MKTLPGSCLPSSLWIFFSAVAEAISLAALGLAVTRPPDDRILLLGISGGIGLALATSALLRVWGERSLAMWQVRAERRFRADLTERILESDWQDFVGQPGHELQSAILAEAPQVAGASATFVRGVATLASSSVIFLTAFLVSVPAATICALFAALIAAAYTNRTRGLGEAQRQLAESTTTITRHTQVMVTGLRSLRFAPVLAAWRGDLDQSLDDQASARALDLLIPMKARLTAEVLGAGMIFGVLGYQALVSGQLIEGLIVMALMLRVLPRVQTAQQALAFSQHSVVWLRRWNDRMAALRPSEGHRAPVESSVAPDGPVLSLTGVGFHYRAHQTPVLSDVSMRLDVGQWVCLLGASGGGKSTLIDLIGGILRPTEGQIEILGRPLGVAGADRLHSEVAIVPQDIHLLGESIREVLTWGGRLQPPVEFDQIIQSLGVTDMFLHSVADLDTRLDELGRDISGGMRTRLAIARALMTGPKVLVLDETTSRLPIESEKRIFADVREAMPSLSVIVVTHRRETASDVGRSLVLSGGRLAAEARDQA